MGEVMAQAIWTVAVFAFVGGAIGSTVGVLIAAVRAARAPDIVDQPEPGTSPVCPLSPGGSHVFDSTGYCMYCEWCGHDDQ